MYKLLAVATYFPGFWAVLKAFVSSSAAVDGHKMGFHELVDFSYRVRLVGLALCLVDRERLGAHLEEQLGLDPALIREVFCGHVNFKHFRKKLPTSAQRGRRARMVLERWKR